MSLIAKRLCNIKVSPTLAVTKKAIELKAEGHDVISLGAGEPDFDTPTGIKDAAKEALDKGLTKYTAVEGTIDLKKAICKKFVKDNKLHYEPDQVIAGCGAKHIIFNAFLATLDENDEVIIPAPYWVSYPDMVEICGGTPVIVNCGIEEDFKLSAAKLEEAITPKTKWLIINSPSNPTGASYDFAELRSLADILLKYPHVNILSDDIYEKIIFDNQQFYTIAQIEPRLNERVLTVNGVSKSYSMTGWRLGYAGGNKELIKAMAVLQSQSTSNPSSISQYAAATALNGPDDFVRKLPLLFQNRRDLVISSLANISELRIRKPEGAFYIFPECRLLFGKRTPQGKKLETSIDVSEYLLEEALVAVVAGSAFGAEGFFRISYAISEETITEACRRITAACRKLN